MHSIIRLGFVPRKTDCSAVFTLPGFGIVGRLIAVAVQDQYIWESPVEQFMPESEYVSRFGSPTKNGLGHRRGLDFNKRKCVIVPESNSMKRRRAHVDKAVTEQVVDDGENHIMGGQSERKFQSVSNDLARQSAEIAPAAVGVATSSFAQPGNVQDSVDNVGRTTTVQVAPSAVANARRLLRRKSSATSDGDDNFKRHFATSVGAC